MKKLLLSLTATALLAVSAQAGVYTSAVGFFTKEIKPDATVALDTIGENVRLYEFTTTTEPKQKCVIIFSESKYKAPVMSCIKK